MGRLEVITVASSALERARQALSPRVKTAGQVPVYLRVLRMAEFVFGQMFEVLF